MVKLNIEIIGEETEILEFAALCSKIEILGSIGASRTIPLDVDGDGSARLRFKIIAPTKKGDRDLMEEWKKLNFKSFLADVESNSSGKLKTHYIGE